MTARDTQRAKLYRAEGVLQLAHNRRGPDPKLREIADCQAFIDRVTGSRWFVRHFGRFSVTVAHGGGKSAARAVGTRRIEIPGWGRQRVVLLHELAHCIASYHHPKAAWHGWQFAAIELKLVAHVMGRDAGAKLKASFKANRVKFRAPRKMSPEAARAAGDRLRALHNARRAFPGATAADTSDRRRDVALAIANLC